MFSTFSINNFLCCVSFYRFTVCICLRFCLCVCFMFLRALLNENELIKMTSARWEEGVSE